MEQNDEINQIGYGLQKDCEVLTRIADMGVEEFEGDKLPKCQPYKFEKTYLPEKNLHLASEYNDFKKILDQDSLNRIDKECQTKGCQDKYSIIFPNCYICNRETTMVGCKKCNQNVLTLCSPKCENIFNGNISLIEFRNSDDKVFLILEDHQASGMILKVIDHNILDNEIGHELRTTIGEECNECIRKYFMDNLEDFEFDNQDDNYQVDLQEYFEENYDNIKKHAETQEYKFMNYTLIAFKCNQCLNNYTFDIGCPNCDQTEIYFCDMCKNAF
jgi:hypothetical protein